MRKILIADGFPLAGHGMKNALLQAIADIEIFEADCLDVAVNLLAEKFPVDMAIFAVPMLGVWGSVVLRDVLESYPGTRFVVLYSSKSRTEVIETLSAGLHGFIARSQPVDEVIGAIKDVLAGRIYVPSSISEVIQLDDGAPTQHHLSSERHHDLSSDIASLTQRQLEVMALLAEGVSNKEIARDLSIVEATVKIHVSAIMRVLGARNRTEAAILVASHHKVK